MKSFFRRLYRDGLIVHLNTISLVHCFLFDSRNRNFFSLPLCKTSLLRIQSAAVPSCIDCVYAMTFSSGALPVQAQYCETELREEQGYNP